MDRAEGRFPVRNGVGGIDHCFVCFGVAGCPLATYRYCVEILCFDLRSVYNRTQWPVVAHNRWWYVLIARK